jgi:hypothetical protein
MRTPRKSISEYLTWILKIYQELQQNREFHISHRLAGHERNDQGQYLVQIHVIGKNIIYKISPEKILENDQATGCFSTKDIRAISFLACENLKEPTHELLGQKFAREENKYVFKVRHGKTGEELERSAEQISADPSLIKGLTPADAHKIGYITANEQIKYEKPKQHEFLGQRFARGLNKFFFKFKLNTTGEEIEKSAGELSVNLDLLQSMSPLDAHKVGYVAANEQVKQERLSTC